MAPIVCVYNDVVMFYHQIKCKKFGSRKTYGGCALPEGAVHTLPEGAVNSPQGAMLEPPLPLKNKLESALREVVDRYSTTQING